MFVGSLCNLELLEDDVIRVPVEWSWIGALFALIAPALYFGKPIVGYGNEFEPEKELELIDRYNVSVNSFPNTALRMMSQVPEMDQYDLSSIRCIISGGEALDESSLRWASETFDAAVIQAYGQTEANALLGNFPRLVENKPKTLGLPGPGCDITLLDKDTGEPITEPDTVGEIAVGYEGNPVCFVEYWNQPTATEEKIRGPWLLTEDLAWRDEDGFYHFKSRKDDVIVSSGHRIGPEEVEDHLGTHEAVGAVAVIGIPDEKRGEVPKAFIELKEGYEASQDLVSTFQSFVKDRMAAYEYPREIEFIDEIPRSTTNKIRRSELRKRELSDE
jgi:acetyl-CoA synthetase